MIYIDSALSLFTLYRTMLRLLRKLLSGEGNKSTSTDSKLDNSIDDEPSDQKQGKRSRSGKLSTCDSSAGDYSQRTQKLPRMNASDEAYESDEADSDEMGSKSVSDPPRTNIAKELPDDTPEWAIKFLEIIQLEFRSLRQRIPDMEDTESSCEEDLEEN